MEAKNSPQSRWDMDMDLPPRLRRTQPRAYCMPTPSYPTLDAAAGCHCLLPLKTAFGLGKKSWR